MAAFSDTSDVTHLPRSAETHDATTDALPPGRHAWTMRLVARLREWQRRRGPRTLRELNDFALKDIGLSRIDVGQWPVDAKDDLLRRHWWV
jgi:uncharacterized protein YjiS (DUF1127 family)